MHEVKATIWNYRSALEFSSTNGYAQSKAFPSLERGIEMEDTRLSFYTTSKILYQTYRVQHNSVGSWLREEKQENFRAVIIEVWLALLIWLIQMKKLVPEWAKLVSIGLQYYHT